MICTFSVFECTHVNGYYQHEHFLNVRYGWAWGIASQNIGLLPVSQNIGLLSASVIIRCVRTFSYTIFCIGELDMDVRAVEKNFIVIQV